MTDYDMADDDSSRDTGGGACEDSFDSDSFAGGDDTFDFGIYEKEKMDCIRGYEIRIIKS